MILTLNQDEIEAIIKNYLTAIGFNVTECSVLVEKETSLVDFEAVILEK